MENYPVKVGQGGTLCVGSDRYTVLVIGVCSPKNISAVILYGIDNEDKVKDYFDENNMFRFRTPEGNPDDSVLKNTDYSNPERYYYNKQNKWVEKGRKYPVIDFTSINPYIDPDF